MPLCCLLVCPSVLLLLPVLSVHSQSLACLCLDILPVLTTPSIQRQRGRELSRLIKMELCTPQREGRARVVQTDIRIYPNYVSHTAHTVYHAVVFLQKYYYKSYPETLSMNFLASLYLSCNQ